ncbi:MAG: hypothetical protein U0235_33160 [Polyangiaceae bacterium]
MGRARVLLSFVAIASSACGAHADPDCPASPVAVLSTARLEPPPSASASTSASASATPPTPAAPMLPRAKLLWTDMFDGGDVRILTLGEDLAVVPLFLGVVIEGSRAAVLDPSGRPRWEQAFPAVGAAAVSATPSGVLLAIGVDTLDWPKTTDAYGQTRLVRLSDKGSTAWRAPKATSLLDVSAVTDERTMLSVAVTGNPLPPVTGTPVETYFVMALARDRIVWQTPLKGPARVFTSAAGDVLAAVAKDRDSVADSLTMLSDKGATKWSLAVPEDCRFGGAAFTPSGRLFIITSASCEAPSWQPLESALGGCRVTELAVSTGKALQSALVEGCLLRADDKSVGVMDTDVGAVTLYDLSLKATAVVEPRRSYCLEQPWLEFALAPESVYIEGTCVGARIGTMVNSPYSRAYDRSTTYLVRYERP